MGYFSNNKVLDYMNHPKVVDGKVNAALNITDICIDFQGQTDARVTVVICGVMAFPDWKVSYGTFNDVLKVQHPSYVENWTNNGKSGSKTLIEFDKDWLVAVECQVMRYMAPILKKPSELPKNPQPAQAPKPATPAPQAQAAPVQTGRVQFNAAAFAASTAQPQQEEEILNPSAVVG